MTSEENRKFKNDLHERFFWTYSTNLKDYLRENGYKYLFRCTHFFKGNYFWVYDRSEELMRTVKEFFDKRESVSNTDN